MKNTIREYAEGVKVDFGHHDGRAVIAAQSAGGYDGTYVDLVDLLEYVKSEMPDVWSAVHQGD
jgi:hypothetical protein